MQPSTILLTVLVAYLLGSIPWPYIVARLARGVDIRTVGNRNMGAANVMREVGRVAGVLAIVGDLSKGALALLFPRWLEAPPELWTVAGLAVVVGHAWPLLLGFRGGIAGATAVGGQLVLLPWQALPLCLLAAPLLWRRTKGPFLGVVLVGSPLLGSLLRQPQEAWLAALAMAALVGLRTFQVNVLRRRGSEGGSQER